MSLLSLLQDGFQIHFLYCDPLTNNDLLDIVESRKITIQEMYLNSVLEKRQKRHQNPVTEIIRLEGSLHLQKVSIMAVEQKDRQSTFWMKMKERTGIQTGVQMMHRM